MTSLSKTKTPMNTSKKFQKCKRQTNKVERFQGCIVYLIYLYTQTSEALIGVVNHVTKFLTSLKTKTKILLVVDRPPVKSRTLFVIVGTDVVCLVVFF